MKRKRQASWGTAVALWQGADRASMGAAAATKAPPVGGPGLVGCGGMGNLGRALASKCKKLHQLSQWKQQLKPTGPTSCGLANQNTRPRSACPNTASRQTANGKRQSGQLSSDLKSNLALGPGPPRNRRDLPCAISDYFPIFLVDTSRNTEYGVSLIPHPSRRSQIHESQRDMVRRAMELEPELELCWANQREGTDLQSAATLSLPAAVPFSSSQTPNPQPCPTTHPHAISPPSMRDTAGPPRFGTKTPSQPQGPQPANGHPDSGNCLSSGLSIYKNNVLVVRHQNNDQTCPPRLQDLPH